jgi:hypothetical protein
MSEYWILDPIARTARFLRRGAGGWREAHAARVYTTPLLRGFRLDLPRLWRRLDEKLRVKKRPKRGR